MRDAFAGSLVELLELAIYTLVSAVLTVGGAVVENAGLADLAAGDTMVGGWLAFLGLLGMVAGYLVGKREVLTRVEALR